MPPAAGDLNATVYPLILRGVRLLGVDSTLPWNIAGYPKDAARWQEWREEREELWAIMAECLPAATLAAVHSETIGLAQVAERAPAIIKAQVAGRVLIDLAM